MEDEKTSNIYDVIIIGGGPAGLTAAIYNSRALLKVLVVEKTMIGGQLSYTDIIENYPGFIEPIGGAELAGRMEQQAKKFGTEIVYDQVNNVEKIGDIFKITGASKEYEGKSVILTVGSENRKLNIKGEDTYTGRGVSYCATCDGAFFKEQRVVVVGGGDSAIKEALFLTKYASHVTVIHRRDKLRAEKVIQKNAFENAKISFEWNSVAKEISGEIGVTNITIEDVKTNKQKKIDIEGVFVFIGMKPKVPMGVDKLADLDKTGYILSDCDMQTKTKGFYVAGDIRAKLLRQVATAVGEGAAASFSVQEYLEEIE